MLFFNPFFLYPPTFREEAKLFIEEVRDRTIRLFDRRLQGKMKDTSSQQLFERISGLSDDDRQLIHDMIPDIVDLCLHNTLCFFEEHNDFKILSRNTNLNDISDGLAGELYSSDGWIERFSEQRHNEN